MTTTIHRLEPHDWPDVKRIYEEGIATGQATFTTSAPAWEEWDKGHLPQARVVARVSDTITGWAGLSAVSSRCVYAGVAEVSIYIASDHRGKGIGKRLMQAVIAESEKSGIWTLQSGIFPENTASIAIHRGCGFREVGRREKLGKLGDLWRDILLLERRSTMVGI